MILVCNYIRFKQLFNIIGRQLAVLNGFRMLSLKSGGKSQKIGGDISPASPAFRMYVWSQADPVGFKIGSVGSQTGPVGS